MNFYGFKKTVSVVVSASLALSFAAFNADINSTAVMSPADIVIGFAFSKVGMGGESNEATTYFNVYGQDVPWDGMFVAYCASACGYAGAVPGGNGTDPNAGVSFFKSRSQWKDRSYIPEKGDIVFLDLDKNNTPDRCAFVAASDTAELYTIEGGSEDTVKQSHYPLNSSVIYGYGTPDYDGNATVPAPLQPVTHGSTYMVTSQIGCWLRSGSDFSNNKLGILNTGQLVVVDEENGRWVHVVNAHVEGSQTPVSGWAHSMNLKKVSANSPAVNVPVTTTSTAPAATTTTSTAPAATTTTTTTTAATTTATTTAPPPVSLKYEEYSVSSPIGAWVRSEPSFSDSNKVGILDSDTIVRVYSIENGWAKIGYDPTGIQNYRTGYIHTSVISKVSYYNPPAQLLYQVTSPIGCRLRKTADLSEGSTIAILDTWQRFEVINELDNDWLYAKVLLNGSYVYGYIHGSNVSPVY